MGPAAMKRPWVVACMLGTWLFPFAAQEAGGEHDFAEVRLPSVAIGKTLSTWRLSQAPFAVHNRTDDTLAIHVEVRVPPRHELRHGVLPVPDRRWLQIESADFVVPPHGDVRADVRLTLPYDPDLEIGRAHV